MIILKSDIHILLSPILGNSWVSPSSNISVALSIFSYLFYYMYVGHFRVTFHISISTFSYFYYFNLCSNFPIFLNYLLHLSAVSNVLFLIVLFYFCIISVFLWKKKSLIFHGVLFLYILDSFLSLIVFNILRSAL